MKKLILGIVLFVLSSPAFGQRPVKGYFIPTENGESIPCFKKEIDLIAPSEKISIGRVLVILPEKGEPIVDCRTIIPLVVPKQDIKSLNPTLGQSILAVKNNGVIKIAPSEAKHDDRIILELK